MSEDPTPWQGKKWNGQSVYPVTRRLEEAGNLARSRMLIQRVLAGQIAAEEHAAAAEIVSLLKRVKFEGAEDLKAEDIHIGYSWDCPSSPTKHCIYDNAADPMHDDCLFCGDPSDRG